ncbi:uncharacterized protein [Argopecten irradians]|uniref:uncharacterized protein n=1 Tax=Argopecten irradians TaxID=31199 RepID=UPI003721422E
MNIYPGKLKTVVHYIYIPRGLTPEASLLVATPSDMSVIISAVHLEYQDDSITMTNGTYIPFMAERAGLLQNFSRSGAYSFGDVECNGTLQLQNLVSTTVASTLYSTTNVTMATSGVDIQTNVTTVSENSTHSSDSQYTTDPFTTTSATTAFRNLTYTTDSSNQSATFTSDANNQSATFTSDANNQSATFTSDANNQSATLTSDSNNQSATLTTDANNQSLL